jgi:hypothetical protein
MVMICVVGLLVLYVGGWWGGVVVGGKVCCDMCVVCSHVCVGVVLVELRSPALVGTS